MLPYVIAAIIGIVVGVAVGIPLGIQRRKQSAEQQIGSAEEEAKRIVNEAYKSAESKKREALVEAKEEIMALGDQENDIAMIEYAGMGVAMDNAIPSVKEVANFVTKSNLEDGVAWAIEKFVLS